MRTLQPCRCVPAHASSKSQIRSEATPNYGLRPARIPHQSRPAKSHHAGVRSLSALRPSRLRRSPVVPDLEGFTIVQRGLMGYEPRQRVRHGFPDIHTRMPVFDD